MKGPPRTPLPDFTIETDGNNGSSGSSNRPSRFFNHVLTPNSCRELPERNRPVEDQYRDPPDLGSYRKLLMDELDIVPSSRLGKLSYHRPSRSWSEHVDCPSNQAAQILHAPLVPEILGDYDVQSQAHLLRHYRDFVSSNIMPLGTLHGLCAEAGEEEAILNQSRSFRPVSLEILSASSEKTRQAVHAGFYRSLTVV
jgi:hypothetical protein